MKPSKPNEGQYQRSIQIVGLLMWRFGLLLAGTTGLYRVSRLLLQFVELPTQLEIGAGVGLTGFGLVIASLIMERIDDIRQEGDLSQ